MKLGFLLAALLTQAPPPPAPKDLLHENSDPPFTLRLPAGYIRAASYENVFSFIKSKGSEAWEKVYVDLVPLATEMEPKVPTPQSSFLKKLPFQDIRENKPIKLPWGNLEIDGLEIRFARDGVDMMGRCAWIPIHPKAVGICVSAPTTLSKELTPEILALLAAFKGRTLWLTDVEAASLRYWSVPGYVVPVLSALFLVVWGALLRGNAMRLHYLRVAWHVAIPIVAAVGWFLVQRSSAARLKLGIETPLYLWFLVILPLAIFHGVMVAHRIRMAVELGD